MENSTMILIKRLKANIWEYLSQLLNISVSTEYSCFIGWNLHHKPYCVINIFFCISWIGDQKTKIRNYIFFPININLSTIDTLFHRQYNFNYFKLLFSLGSILKKVIFISVLLGFNSWLLPTPFLLLFHASIFTL